MRTFITLLALCAFTLHLLLGCCAHHAHGDEGLPGHQHAGHGYNHLHLPAWLASPAKPCDHHDHAHSCDAQPGHEHQHDGPTPQLPCADPDCVYVAAGISAASDLDLAGLDQTAPWLVTVPELLSDMLAPGWNTGEGVRNPEISPHLRRHVALARFLN